MHVDNAFLITFYITYLTYSCPNCKYILEPAWKNCVWPHTLATFNEVTPIARVENGAFGVGKFPHLGQENRPKSMATVCCQAWQRIS